MVSVHFLFKHQVSDISNIMKDSENTQNQLVAYDRAVFGADETASFQNQYRVSPPIADFTIQCAFCSQWRTLPMEKYEEIRERILELPFVCKAAREWRPDISCQVQSDIVEDESRLWAIDKPNIPQPPLGWERILKIRAAGGTKFADVYVSCCYMSVSFLQLISFMFYPIVVSLSNLFGLISGNFFIEHLTLQNNLFYAFQVLC